MIKIDLNVLIVSIGLMAIVSGCVGGQDVTSAFKALPEVQQFMAEHPNAKITVTYWSKEEVTQSIQEISQQCDKPITPVAMYKATISEGDLKVVSWINAENQIVVCSTTQGSGGSQIENPTPTPIQTQTSTSTSSPTIITVSNYPDTPTADLIISHRGGDILKGGEWKLSVVNTSGASTAPVFITSVLGSDLTFGDQIKIENVTSRCGKCNLTKTSLNVDAAYPGLVSGTKYDVKFVHVPSNTMLLDTIVEVR